MPTVGIRKDILDHHLGAIRSKEEVEELCFKYGLELDDVAVEKDLDGLDHEIYKIDIPANRYDLLCAEGLSRAWLIFEKKMSSPKYEISNVDIPIRIIVEPETINVRKYVIGAVLRDIDFNVDSYASFIDLQDKLHQNLGRKRTIASVGTHDFDTVKMPVRYRAIPPKDICFQPLNQAKEYTAVEQMHLFADTHLREYLPIISENKLYPIIQDSNNRILSMPPIINSEHSKISLSTRNVFIEATGTDLKKLEIFLDTLVAIFSQYCEKPFMVEPVEIQHPDGRCSLYPKLSTVRKTVDLEKIGKKIGISIDKDTIVDLLTRMCLACYGSDDPTKILVEIPPTRQDILHECDIAEDVALAYGYNSIPPILPSSNTIAQPFELNKLSDHLRHVLSGAGWTEALSFTLCSFDDISEKVRKPGSNVIKISNPKTLDFQCCRNSLLPGILKTISNNKDMPLPLKLFEVQDVLFIDKTQETKCRNERHLGAIFYSKYGGFEIIHGLLDRVMVALDIPFSKVEAKSYCIEQANDPTYFDGRCAQILFDGKSVGIFGILHPELLSKFSLSNPASYIEMSIEPFL